MAETDTLAASGFAAALAEGSDWRETAEACLAALGPVPPGANLGFLYATDALADDSGRLLDLLRQRSGVAHWVGTTGFGVAGSGAEIYDRPALSLLVGRFPDEAFRVFPAVSQDLDGFHQHCGVWLQDSPPILGVVHGDPRNPKLPDLIADLSEETAAFLVGGLASTRSEPKPIADEVAEGGLSGVLFGSGVEVAAGLSQGCSPIGPSRRITASDRNIVMTLDERPALEVLLEDVEVEDLEALQQAAANTLVAFPVTGSDTGDYLVRNLMGVDPERGWIAVGEMVQSGQAMLFCRRDREAAETDLRRMLAQLKGRLSGPPRGALYFSCIARGENLFGPGSAELRLIRDELGDLPLAGFFANGEISNNRLYGYTGVLALFL